MDVTQLESRKSTPDRFIQYRLGSFVDNSPGHIIGDGEKLPDIQEELDSQNKSTLNIGAKSSKYRGLDATTPDKHSSQR